MATGLQKTIPLRDLDAVGKPIAEAKGMPRSAYTDETLFHFERDQILGKTWAGLAFASELVNKGSLVPADFMGLPLLMARDRQGSIRVFHNVCSHRGMTLVSETKHQARSIRCPYHSWDYDFNGDLKATPFIGGVGVNQIEGFSCDSNGLTSVRSHIWMGIIFVNLSGDAPDFEDFIAPLAHRWEAFVSRSSFNGLHVSQSESAMEITIQANWKLAVENYCEAYHLPWVHPSLNKYSPLSEHYNIVFTEEMSGQGTYVYALSEVAGTELPQFEDWPADKMRHAEYISLYPNVLLGLQVDHAFAMILQPRSCESTFEKVQLYYVGEEALGDRYQACRSSVLESWRQVFGEDVFALEGMQKARHSPSFSGGLFSPVMDIPSHHFHQWVAQRYSENTG
ncbi:MAG: aromatic ring-hydroxylating dioxygenase subunit alpha [Proteobacteria bacterium]|nr:aromatic ring-hydroxylating dioxygenase subunit alpha [Pseudomonadota bacterium]MDA1351568.1 aromatic ring-hydroxylating dioxygenase subunit alpha [Pseudomonadota bacterium]